MAELRSRDLTQQLGVLTASLRDGAGLPARLRCKALHTGKVSCVLRLAGGQTGNHKIGLTIEYGP